MTFTLPQPSAREDKPSFAALPLHMHEKIADVLGSPVIDGEAVYGGFSPSAGYRLILEDGRKVFAKGTHPEEMSHGAETVRQEIKIYQTIDVLKDISPAYLGVVADGNEDGWMLGLWDFVEVSEEPITANDIVDILIALQSDQSAEKKLEWAQRKNYISFFFESDRKWKRIAGDKKIRDKFMTLFADKNAAETWFQKNSAALIQLQDMISTVAAPSGLIHGDLRLDNLIKKKTGSMSVIDWPNACYGPLVFDAVFLLAHTSVMGHESMADLFTLYHQRGGTAASLQDRHIVMAVIAGFFADQAYRQVPERLPRLRWMQKSMLYALLTALHLDGVIESPPEFAA